MKINLHHFPFEYGKVVSTPTAREGGKTFSLNNQSGFVARKWAIDKIVFKDSTEERCDYLIIMDKEDSKVYYWIELKGNDNIKACKQILNTLELVEVEASGVQQARIVSSGVNQVDLRDIIYLKLKKKMLRQGGDLIIYTNKGEETI